MNHPIHAKHYADQCCCETVVVTARVELAEQTYLVRFARLAAAATGTAATSELTAAPSEIAARVTPGQFMMVRLPGCHDPILGRAFAMYDVINDADGTPSEFEIVFHVAGKMTSLLALAHVGQQWMVWGPLGNGFLPQPAEHLVMVAGGIGQTPFLSLAKEALGRQHYGGPSRVAVRVPRVSLCYGARSACYFAGLEEFRRLGVDVHLATDDGSLGHHGYVSELLDEVVEARTATTRIVCCGPERMMAAVAGWADQAGVSCEVSLETPMACGLGICFSCVTRVKVDEETWDYKRTCVDGPVFRAESLAW